MFMARRPSPLAIGRFLHDSWALPLSYAPIGIVRGQTSDHALDEQVMVIGRGRSDFVRARDALMAWKQFEIGWVELFPRPAPVDAGTVVAVLIRTWGSGR